MKAPNPPFIANRSQEYLLLFGSLFVALPHVFHLNPEIFWSFILLVTWRFATIDRPRLYPNRPLLMGVTLLGMALVFHFHHRFFGRDAGASLLLIGFGLKLLEMKTRREVYLVVYLAFFVALTQYLFSQTIPMAAYTLLAVGLLVAVLIGLNAGPSLSWKIQAKLAATLVGQALPVMVVLFIFFPRIQGPLWKLPDERNKAKSGLSEVIEPGSISALSLSAESAFRVDFAGTPPPPAERYWRGPTFWSTDGKRWTLKPDRFLAKSHKPVFRGLSYQYTVTLEPHQKTWVFALDLPAIYPPDLRQTAEYLLLTKDKINQRRQFRLTSYPQFNTGELSPTEQRWGLQLPDRPSPRIRELLEHWRAQVQTPKDWVNLVLRYFHEESFFYTLNPPDTEHYSVETFLFETRKGFCEHYATTFVYLMRAAGVPARIVTGYQGGQWNSLGKFLEVRQADAHAWAEVWLAETGWTRVDPTAAVAPGRIEYGIDLDQQVSLREVSFNPLDQALIETTFNLRLWYKQFRMAWATLDHAWSQWVLSYNPENQKRFWESLGIIDWRSLSLWLGGLLALCGMLVSLSFLPRRTTKIDPEVVLYQRFLNKLSHHGIVRRPAEGPLDFAHRAISAKPESGPDIAKITEVFVQIRYGRQSTPHDLEQLRRLVKAFRMNSRPQSPGWGSPEAQS
jgi:transglutaminase-like putative cysteine protease